MNSSTIPAGLEIDQFYLKDLFLPVETRRKNAKHYANMILLKTIADISKRQELCAAKIKVRSKSQFLLDKITEFR